MLTTLFQSDIVGFEFFLDALLTEKDITGLVDLDTCIKQPTAL